MNLKATNKTETNKYELEVEISAEDFNKALSEVAKTEGKKMSVPGFRKGHAPRSVIEKMYGENVFFEAAVDKLYRPAMQDAIEASGLEVIAVSNADVTSVSRENGIELKLTVVVKPVITIEGYKGIEATKKNVEVTDEDVSAELVKVQDRNSRMVDVDNRGALTGDTAVIDFEGFCDGKAFEGGKAEGFELSLGSGQFIPGFEDQLIGCKAGDEKDVKVTFPEDYFEKSLAGKEAVFAVKVNDVKRSELPAIDDEFAKEAGKFDSVDDLKADIRKRLESKASFQALEKFNSEVLKTAVNNAEVDIPQVMIDDKIDQMIEELAMKLETQRMSLDDYLKYMNQDMDKLKEHYAEPAKENVKMDLVLEAIAKAENIEVKDIDLQAEIITMAQNFGADPKEVYKIILKEHRVPMLVQSVGRKKAASFILKNAVDPNEDKKEEAKAEDAKAED